MIHAVISGRLGQEPKEIRHESGGCSFSIAADHGFGDNKTTTWVDVTVWGARGKTVMPLLSKGRAVVVRGELYSEDRDGKTWLKLRSDDVELVGPRPDGAGESSRTSSSSRGSSSGGKGSSSSRGASGKKTSAMPDDIPF